MADPLLRCGLSDAEQHQRILVRGDGQAAGCAATHRPVLVRAEAMESLRTAAVRKLLEGVTTFEEVVAVTGGSGTVPMSRPGTDRFPELISSP